MSIERLPGTNATPTFFLHKMLENVDRIESIVAVVKWDDGRYQTTWTSQELRALAMASICAQDVLRRAIMTEEFDEPPHVSKA